ncbi:MAG: nucleotidyltransferase family protein [Pseudanabaenaceae cyanobacterium]|jgi:predicted nucleotidyltransferase
MNPSLVKNIDLPLSQIREFCQRWQIVEFALFGSVLRDDFHPDSDIDCLVVFAPNSQNSLLDLVTMEWQLEDIFHRKVDLVTKQAVIDSPNWIRRKAILNTAQVIYETRSSLSA